MTSKPIISVRNLTKSYRLYTKPSDRLKEVLWPWKARHTLFHALSDVNFDVYPGEYLGIVGQNGAGKSTLLQILTGVLTPTSGTVEINGRVAALLELGAGFNLELTGRENVVFQMQLAGIEKEAMPAKLEKIRAFADVGEFFEQPVKLYSSGMFARVAFSSAILTEPEILIVDEVLAVGDIKFQVKCHDRLEQFKEAGGTVLFVTHALDSITSFCTKALYLKSGSLHMMGDPKTVTKTYYNDQFRGNTPIARKILEEERLQAAGCIPIRPVTTQEMIDVCLRTTPVLGDGSARIVNCGFYDAQGEKAHTLEPEAQYYFHTAVIAKGLIAKGAQLAYVGCHSTTALPASNFFDFNTYGGIDNALDAGIETFRPDVLYAITHGLLDRVYRASKRHAIPFAVDLHAIRSLEVFSEDRALKEKYQQIKTALRWEIALCHAAAITVANPVLYSLVSALTAKAFPVIGIADDAFSPPKQAMRGDAIRLLYAGNALQYQGLTLLFNALELLPTNIRQRLRCEIILSQHKSEALEKRLACLQSKGLLFVTPFVPSEQFPTLLSEIELFVVPRPSMLVTYLAFPQKLVDSLSAGCCVLASDIAPHRFAITHGENGFLFKPSPRHLAEAIITACNADDERMHMRQKAYARAKATYGITTQAGMIYQVLHSILSKFKKGNTLK